jgi:hypothetical protein
MDNESAHQIIQHKLRTKFTFAGLAFPHEDKTTGPHRIGPLHPGITQAAVSWSIFYIDDMMKKSDGRVGYD